MLDIAKSLGPAATVTAAASAVTADATGVVDFSLPSWSSDVGIVTLIILFGIALARNWLYTNGQVSHIVSQYEKVATLWEKVASERQDTIKLLSDNAEPILKSNEAILRAVEELQNRQEWARQRYDWPRDQTEGDWRP